MTIVPKKKNDTRPSKPAVLPSTVEERNDDLKTDDIHRRASRCSSPAEHDDCSGYNSGDEHINNHDRNASYMQWSDQELVEREMQFEDQINKKGWIIKKMAEDGACLFRAVADQIYGDQDMHSVLRKLCIDYIAKNSDYYSHYVTEDFGEYLKRKSLDHSHGNHIEIQAMSEMFNRPIEVYHYSSEPINIFQGVTNEREPIRLSYHRSVHYNSIVNPYKPTVGVGLGLPTHDSDQTDRSLLEKAIRISDEDAIEKAMLEDKLIASDWEATTKAIEQQVARESYLEWLRENETRKHKRARTSSSPQPATTSCSQQQESSSNHRLSQASTSSSAKRMYGDFMTEVSLNETYNLEASTSSSSTNNSSNELTITPIQSTSTNSKTECVQSSEYPKAGSSRDVSE